MSTPAKPRSVKSPVYVWARRVMAAPSSGTHALSSSAKLAAWALADRASLIDEASRARWDLPKLVVGEWASWPLLETLAEDVGQRDAKTVGGFLRQLIDRGWLVCVTRRGSRQSNVYVLAVDGTSITGTEGGDSTPRNDEDSSEPKGAIADLGNDEPKGAIAPTEVGDPPIRPKGAIPRAEGGDRPDPKGAIALFGSPHTSFFNRSDQPITQPGDASASERAPVRAPTETPHAPLDAFIMGSFQKLWERRSGDAWQGHPKASGTIHAVRRWALSKPDAREAIRASLRGFFADDGSEDARFAAKARWQFALWSGDPGRYVKTTNGHPNASDATYDPSTDDVPRTPYQMALQRAWIADQHPRPWPRLEAARKELCP